MAERGRSNCFLIWFLGRLVKWLRVKYYKDIKYDELNINF